MVTKSLRMEPVFEGLIQLTQTNVDTGEVERQEILTIKEVKNLFKEYIKSELAEYVDLLEKIDNINQWEYLVIQHTPLEDL